MTSLLAVAAGTNYSGDPLFADGVDWGDAAVVAVKVLIVFVISLVSVLFMVWFERKVIADMQDRIGPDRAGGKFGLLQALADGTKLIFKEDLLPERADKHVFRLAPYLALIPAFLTFAILPFGGIVEIFGKETRLQLADPPAGVLWLLLMSSVAVYGTMLAGWSSGSKYPLLGSVRASAQMVSYEAALALSVAAVVVLTGSLHISDIVAAQAEPLRPGLPDWIHSWNILALVFVPFVIFFIGSLAEMNRLPFDLTEAESELVGGYHTEYSSIRFGMFFLAEFMNAVISAGIITALFLGGGDGPVLTDTAAFLWPVLWFSIKTFLLMYAFVWIRGTLPRMRYDQLMDLGWKLLIPLSLAWLLFVAATRLELRYGLLVGGGMIVAGLILYTALGVGKARHGGDDGDDFGTPQLKKATPKEEVNA